MDENLHKDPLEELFRKKLEDQNLEKKSASPDEWDLPADNLWDKIGSAVEVQAPVKGIWVSSKLQLIAIAASILLIIGVFTCFQSYQTQLNSLSQKVEELSSQKELNNSTLTNEQEGKLEEVPATETPTKANLPKPTLNKQDSKSKLDPSPSEAPATTENRKQNSAIRSNPPADKNTLNRNTKPDKASSTSTAGISSPPDFTNPKKTTETTTTTVQQNPELILAEQKPSNSPSSNSAIPLQEKQNPEDSEAQIANPNTITWTELPSLSTAQITLLDQKQAIVPLPNTAKQPIIKPVRKLASKGFYAGLLYAPTATFIEVQVPKKHPRRPKLKKEKTILTAFQGLKLGYQINPNWSIEIEGRYSNATIENENSFELNYSKQKERKDGQRYEGNYDSSIPTAYGDFDTEIVLFREASTDIPDQTAVNINLASKQTLQLLSIPVLAKYSFGRGPIRLTARAGVAANFILDDQVELSVASIDQMGLSARGSKFNPIKKGLGKNNFDYLLGFGLDFQANKNWRVSLEPTFSRAFSPIYEKGRFTAIPKKASVALAVNYQF